MTQTDWMCQERGRGLISIEYCVDASIKGFKNYIKKNKKRLITATNKSIGNIRRQTEKQ